MDFFYKIRCKKTIKENRKLVDLIHPHLKDLLKIEEYDLVGKNADGIFLCKQTEHYSNQNFFAYSKFDSFISYVSMTPRERYAYLYFLSDPYQQNNKGIKHGMAFVRCLYHELERHLYNGGFEQAYDIITRLRSIYEDEDFRKTSAISIALCCLMRKKYDKLKEFVNDIDDEEADGYSYLPIDILIMAKGAVGSDIFWNEIINRRLIFEDAKTDPSCFTDFDQRFEKEFEKTFGDCCLDSSALLNDAKSLPSYEYKPFLNPYLSNVTVAIPDYTQHAYFFEGCKGCFQNVRQSIADDINRAIEEEQEKKSKKRQSRKNVFIHGHLSLNEKEEVFYSKIIADISFLWNESDLIVWQKGGMLHFEDVYGGIGWVKLTGRIFKMGLYDIVINNDYGYIHCEEKIYFCDIESLEHALSMIDKMVGVAFQRKEFHSKYDSDEKIKNWKKDLSEKKDRIINRLHQFK